MHANRIRRYFRDLDRDDAPSTPGGASTSAFVALPAPLVGVPPISNADSRGELYRLAYEQARERARERLLDLLASRARLLGDHN